MYSQLKPISTTRGAVLEPISHSPCYAREQIINNGGLPLIVHEGLLPFFIIHPSIQYNINCTKPIIDIGTGSASWEKMLTI